MGLLRAREPAFTARAWPRMRDVIRPAGGSPTVGRAADRGACRLWNEVAECPVPTLGTVGASSGQREPVAIHGRTACALRIMSVFGSSPAGV